MVDAFVGNFTLESRDNFEPFLKGIGVPDEHIEAAKNSKAVETKISKDGDNIIIHRKRPQRETENKFKLGEPTEIENLKGEKVPVTINLEGGKLVAKGNDYELVSEIAGGKLKEVITFKGHTMTRVFARK